MTFEEWAATVERGVTINPQMAFAAGAASRDAEIAELVAANRIACEDLIEQQNLRVTYAEQIAELKDALGYDWDKYKVSQESLREHMQMVAQKDAEIAELVAALSSLLCVIPAEVECNNMHHVPKHRHSHDETCPVVVAYGEAILQASKALAKVRKQT